MRLGDRTERIEGSSVNREFFEALGARAQLGRLFLEEDMRSGPSDAVVLTDATWRSRFNGDPGILGKGIVLDGTPRTIVGVLPKKFAQFGREGVYVPLVIEGSGANDRGSLTYNVLGRLRPGLSLPAAQQAMKELSSRLAAQYPEDAENSARLQLVEEAFVEDAQALLLMLLGAVGFVLLIGCANIANLLLARGTARSREMTVRAALGASKWRLCRHLLAESMLLAVLGGVLALLPAMWGIDLIVANQIDELPNVELATLDGSVLAFTLALSVMTGILFGLIPAWQTSKINVSEALKSSNRSLAGGSHRRLRSLLVISEVALTLILLVGAGLMLQSFLRLRSANPGYDSRGVLTMRVALADKQYADPQKQVSFYEQTVQQARTLPGVRSVSAISALPTSDDIEANGLFFPDLPKPRPQDIPVVFRSEVMNGFFHTMQIPLLRGRDFDDSDRKTSAPVVIVDEWTAKRYLPNQDPIGKRIRVGGTDMPVCQIVGIVGTVEQSVMTRMMKGHMGQVYFPFVQHPTPALSLVIRADGDPGSLTAGMREVVRAIDRDQPIFQAQTLDAVRAAGRAAQRLATWLLGCFGVVALLLATIGVYGVMSYTVGQRTHEFGIRMSLGAQPRDVLKLVARQAVVFNSIGIAVGLAGAWFLTRMMGTLLYGIRATDPFTFIAVTVFLAAITLSAGYVPARRATRVDPVQALRDE